MRINKKLDTRKELGSVRVVAKDKFKVKKRMRRKIREKRERIRGY